MKSLLRALLIMLLPAVAAAGTLTTNYSLTKPAAGESGWGTTLNDDLDLIDTALATGKTALQTATCADSGNGSPGTLTLDIQKSLVRITNNDADGCTVTIAETSATQGMTTRIFCASAAGSCNFADQVNVFRLNGGTALSLTDTASGGGTLEAVYDNGAWRQGHRPDYTINSAAAITGGTINNTTVGLTTPAAGEFTTLTAGHDPDNIYFGAGAGNLTSTGVGKNSGFGRYALNGLTTGTNNFAGGWAALSALDVGNYNTAGGYAALRLLSGTGASFNTAFGGQAMGLSTTAHDDTAFGYAALYNNLTSQSVTAIGGGALESLTGGDNNTAVGLHASFGLLTGANNTALGHSACYSATTASGNVCLGFNAGFYETGSNKFFLDNAPRVSEADARIKALVYGVFGATVADQSLVFNVNSVDIGNIANTRPQNTQLWIAGAGPAAGTANDARLSLGIGTNADYGAYIASFNQDNTGGGMTTVLGTRFVGVDQPTIYVRSAKVGIKNNDPGSLLSLGLAGATLGTMDLQGSTSGVITIKPQVVAGTYNFNLPTSAGSAGQPLLSGGGAEAAQTYGTLGSTYGGTGAVLNAAASGTYPKSNGATPAVYAASTLAAAGTGSCTNQFVTALNGDAAPSCSTATLASAQFANQGTTTQVLHGNAAGQPGFAAVVDGDITPAYSGTGSCTNQVVTGLSRATTPTCSSLTQAMATSGFHLSTLMGSSGTTTLSPAVANYFPLSGIAAPSATEADVQMVAPVAGTIAKLACLLTAAPTGATQSYALAVRVNTTTTAVTCSITDTATTCTDSAHSVAVAAGDTIDVIATPANTPTASAARCSVELQI